MIYQAAPNKTQTLERNTGSTCKGAWGLTEPQVPHNSSYNLIKILTGTLATNGRATNHLYSESCGVSSCWEMELFSELHVSDILRLLERL